MDVGGELGDHIPADQGASYPAELMQRQYRLAVNLPWVQGLGLQY